MERPYILHMFTPGRQMSPFDVNMAADAGYQIIVPYAGVELDGIAAMTQDAIFSRGPKGVSRTGIFIGGRDALLAADMLQRCKESMVKPFVVSAMADPSGAYTTAAAMLACVEAAWRRLSGGAQGATGLQKLNVVVLGGTGPVGRVAGVLAAQAGAKVALTSRHGVAAAEAAANDTAARFGVVMHGLSTATPAELHRTIAGADVLLGCAAAGVQVMSAADLAFAKRLKVAADLNAVPPEGIAGISVMDNEKPLGSLGAVGIGALTIGNVKYQTQHRLLLRMLQAEKAQHIGFAEAHAMALEVLAEKAA